MCSNPLIRRALTQAFPRREWEQGESLSSASGVEGSGEGATRFATLDTEYAMGAL